MKITKNDLRIITGYNKGEYIMNFSIIPFFVGFFVSNDLLQWIMFVCMVLIFIVGFVVYFKSSELKASSDRVKYWNTYFSISAVFILIGILFFRILTY